MSAPKILLVDDDPQSLHSTQKILSFAGYEVTTAQDGQAALDRVRPTAGREQESFDLIVTDVRMPRLGGLELLRAISVCGDRTPVILMTAFGRVEDAVWAMKLGAVDFLTKPFKRQTLLSSVEAVLKRARRSIAVGAGALTSGTLESRMIGDSSAIRSLRETIARVSGTAASVLLSGESGTGKELVARCIHDFSPRRDGPFVALNCAAVPEQLIEAELFGFEKGSFTGATGSKEGLFQAAHGGTLLLDEIGEMPFALQTTLLRVLQEGEIRRIGATTSRKVDVRVIAATNRELHSEVQAGRFRQDLLYRLEVVGLRVPALREREGDIRRLAFHFLRESAIRHAKEVRTISEQALAALDRHSWPGNIRELANVIERAVIFANSDELTVSELPQHLNVVSSGETEKLPHQKIEIALGTPLKDVEELLIRKTLEATDGDKSMTARLLGINSRTIYRRLDGKKPADEARSEEPEKAP